MDLVLYTLRSVAYVIVEPSLMLILVLLGVMFFIKNRRLVVMQKMIVGESVNSPLELTLSQIVLGIFAGILASLILSHLGVIFTRNSGIEFLFMLSVLLMFIKPRFVCFSYSGAVLGIVSLIFTYFNITTSNGEGLFRVDIMALMTFVGVLHIVEGILVMFDGDRGAIPVFSNRNGRIIGGYALSRYWVLPIAIFIAYSTASVSGAGTESIGTPGWWPLLNSDSIMSIINTMVLTLLPMFGVLGYSSVTFTRKKKEKAISSGIFTLGFGILLTLVAQLARFGFIGEIIVVLFAPLAHEGMMIIQRKLEEKRSPIFVSGADGISILEVIPYSKAFEHGLRAGDKILSINDKEVLSEKEIYSIVKEGIYNFTLRVRDKRGSVKEIYMKNDNRGFGAVLVPKAVTPDKVVSFENRNFSEVLQKIKENRENKDK
ncbi:signal protein PDZ [Clostridium paraputrificum]|uniref:signal protein PDZ n=1 Tax=Clostridium paraputrificum TaxID=29363 RepID=UPI003D33C996